MLSASYMLFRHVVISFFDCEDIEFSKKGVKKLPTKRKCIYVSIISGDFDKFEYYKYFTCMRKNTPLSVHFSEQEVTSLVGFWEVLLFLNLFVVSLMHPMLKLFVTHGRVII